MAFNIFTKKTFWVTDQSDNIFLEKINKLIFRSTSDIIFSFYSFIEQNVGWDLNLSIKDNKWVSFGFHQCLVIMLEVKGDLLKYL